MSECTIDSNVDDFDSTTLQQIIRKANKPHTCEECRRSILKGERYEVYKGVCDGSMYTAKTCLDCVSLRTSFFNSCWTFGIIRDEIADSISYSHGAVDSACIVNLTPAAKNFVFEHIEKEWEKI